MLSRFVIARKRLTRRALALGLLALAACDQAAILPGGAATGPRVEPGAPVTVALLLPRTSAGGGALLSDSLENAARLALADVEGENVDLRVYDTAGAPGPAAEATRRAIADGASVIVGPLFAQAAAAAGVTAGEAGVNVLAFSNNADIAGGNVFVLGTSFGVTADRLTRYAVAQGDSRIHVVHAASTAEVAGRDAIVAAISRSRANLAGTTSFPPSAAGASAAVPEIAAAAASADAIFFTSGNLGALPVLTDGLAASGVRPPTVAYVGLQRLDLPSGAVSRPSLQGALFALPDPGAAGQFRARYVSAYGAAPHPLAPVAYDGMRAIATLLAEGRSDAVTARALTRGNGFVGATGAFRIGGDGITRRALAVARIEGNQVQVVDPAPSSLRGAGS